jgi:hypothetical protein
MHQALEAPSWLPAFCFFLTHQHAAALVAFICNNARPVPTVLLPQGALLYVEVPMLHCLSTVSVMISLACSIPVIRLILAAHIHGIVLVVFLWSGWSWQRIYMGLTNMVFFFPFTLCIIFCQVIIWVWLWGIEQWFIFVSHDDYWTCSISGQLMIWNSIVLVLWLLLFSVCSVGLVSSKWPCE